MQNHRIRVLVTGSEGFIGKHLCRALIQHPDVEEVREFDIKNRLRKDITNSYDVQSIMLNFNPDMIFHLAALTKVEYEVASDMVYVNVNGTHNLLRFAPKHCRFVLASSIHCQYNQSLYAASKLAAEQLVECYTRMGLIDGVVLRLTSCVGSGMTHGVLKDILHQLTTKPDNLRLIGNAPGSTRPFIHVHDVVHAMMYLGIEKEEKRTYTVATTKPLTIADVAKITMLFQKWNRPITWSGKSWLGDVSDIIYDRCDYLDGFVLKYPTSEQAIIQAVKDNL